MYFFIKEGELPPPSNAEECNRVVGFYSHFLEILKEKEPEENVNGRIVRDYINVSCEFGKLFMPVVYSINVSGLEQGQERRIDFSKPEDRSYFERTDFERFLGKMESRLHLGGIELYLARSELSSFYLKMRAKKM